MYLGNFTAPHSTETHVGQALEACGHHVVRVQEDKADWVGLARLAHEEGAAFVLWTHTRDYGPPATYEAQLQFLDDSPVPVVGYHLDLWFGLRRARLVREEPYFKVDLLVTADGGHPEEWMRAGVNHRWMPPGVSEFECQPGTPRDEYRSPVVFVGSHQNGYHPESRHRFQLVRELRRRSDVTFWPRPGEHAVRGDNLRDLYASATVAVGDSCLVGTGLARYWSDRVPETVGRGACLIHPAVDGLFEHYEDGKHLYTWQPGDWRSMHRLLDMLTADPDLARRVGQAGREHVLQNHTYTVRMRQLEALLRLEGIL